MSDVSSRSEEHTSELQSRQYLVCRLLLEKKKFAAGMRPRRALAHLHATLHGLVNAYGRLSFGVLNLFCFATRGPPGSTLFPYTTLFRSGTEPAAPRRYRST